MPPARTGSCPDRPPVCGWTFDGRRCRRRGEHLCQPRAAHAQAFFAEILVHTKGTYARRPFELAPWQRDGIVRPVFGTVRWSAEQGAYVRRYQVVWVELARKNGKTSLLAGIMLYLLVADGEESAEIYGCARDRDQASLAFDTAARMVQLSPVLRRRLIVRAHVKRIVDPRTASFYQVIAADAPGALGSNPHGVAADEILAWRDRSMWDALRTGMGSGARRQPLMVAATTAGSDPAGFAAAMHAEMQRVADTPDRAPHVHVFMRNTPDDADPYDERTWPAANPALDDFLSREALRAEALEARNDPAAENGFRQFRLCQWVRQSSRWMPMHLWDAPANTGTPWPAPDTGRHGLAGREAWAGYDLAAKLDLCAWTLLFPPEQPGGPVDVLWRFWLPEDALPVLDKTNDGKFTRWARQGWLTITEGGVLDFDRMYRDIAADAELFAIRGADGDEWSTWPVIGQLARHTGLDLDAGQIQAYRNTYERMSPGMTETMALVKQGQLAHHGNPVARFCMDCVEIRRAPYEPNLIRPDKPARDRTGKRIDAVTTLALAVNAWRTRGQLEPRRSAYEDHDLQVV